MTWWEAEIYARAGTPVRRRAWLSDGGLLNQRIVYSAGVGTTRAIAVVRNGTSEAVVQSTNFSASDCGADDWEKAA